jgi:putative component of toxin-antitoxin plasmid stabilization module
MRVTLNTRSTRRRLSDKKASLRLNDRASRVKLYIDVEAQGVNDGIFDYTFDSTFE